MRQPREAQRDARLYIGIDASGQWSYTEFLRGAKVETSESTETADDEESYHMYIQDALVPRFPRRSLLCPRLRLCMRRPNVTA